MNSGLGDASDALIAYECIFVNVSDSERQTRPSLPDLDCRITANNTISNTIDLS